MPGSSSARCSRCASTSSRPATPTSSSSCSTRSGRSRTSRSARSSGRSSAVCPRRSSATFDAESFAAASIGQVHRATLPTGELVAVKVQRPGIRESLQADIDLMYAFSRLIDWTHLFGATRSRDGHRRVRPLDGRRARLPRRGPPGCPALRARQGRAVRADRPRLPRLHDVARPDRRAHRGHPADRHHRRPARGEHGLPRRPDGARIRPRSGRPASRLEHAQPGLRVRLLPRRPPPRQPVRAAGRRDRLRRLRHRRPAPRRRPRVAHALRLAAVPGRGRGRHRRAHALARADAGHRRGGRPRQLFRVHQAFFYDISGRRTPGPVRRCRPARAAGGQPVLEARGRHHEDRSASTS